MIFVAPLPRAREELVYVGEAHDLVIVLLLSRVFTIGTIGGSHCLETSQLLLEVRRRQVLEQTRVQNALHQTIESVVESRNVSDESLLFVVPQLVVIIRASSCLFKIS